MRNGRRHHKTALVLGNYLLLARWLGLPDEEARARLDAERQKAGLTEEEFAGIWAEVLEDI